LCILREGELKAADIWLGSICNVAANQMLFATVMGIIELFEITMAVSTAWIIVSELLRGLRENHWLS
jgi:hypothetical protein